VEYQKFGNRTTKCGSSHVKCRIAGIQVVRNLREEKCRSLLARRTNWRRHCGKRRTGTQAIGHAVHLTVDYESNEIKKGGRFHWDRFLVWLKNPFRLWKRGSVVGCYRDK
jgi:hypothetical protein